MILWHDAVANAHRRAIAPRIVSLVPSITELLFDLGLGGQVVGRTGFCVHPKDAVAKVPKVGGTKDVKLDRLRALEPTHVIVNVDENDATLVEELRDFGASVIVTHPNGPADNIALYRLLGGIFDAEAAAERLASELQAELALCATMIWPAESVLYLIWKAPWMTIAANTYIAGTLALVNWRVKTAAAGWAGADRYPVLADLAHEAADVDRILLSTEPYLFNESDIAEVQQLTRKPTALIDAEMVSWYGSRAIRGTAYLRWFRERLLLPGA